MIPRPDYINQLRRYRDVPVVKILTGVRRCGKSTILAMLKNDLLQSGVLEENIVSKKYSDANLRADFDARAMYGELKAACAGGGRHYFLLDEVQEVEGWEKTVNTLLEEGQADIYVTGSNSKLLSSEISTYLTGRYVAIHIYTLSFREYKQFKEGSILSEKELLNEYIRFGGFPAIVLSNLEPQTAYQIAEGIYASVVGRDITQRHAVKNGDMFNRVVRFILENVGKTFSANSIVNFMKGEKRAVTVEAIYNYLEWLEKAYIIYRCRRYDLQGKAVLKTQEKFYLADMSFKYALMGFDPKGVASALENIVFFELRRRGYTVHIGKNAAKEIDFVATKFDEKLYIQVCRNIPLDASGHSREIQNLEEIRDHYPKYVVTMDELMPGNTNGIRIVHMVDFLTKEW